MLKEKPSYLLRIKVAPYVRDFLIYKFGESFDVNQNYNLLNEIDRELYLNIRARIKQATISRSSSNKQNKNLTAEFLIQNHLTAKISPTQSKKIGVILYKYFKHTLCYQMAISDKHHYRDRLREFIEQNQIFHEDAYDHIVRSLTRQIEFKNKKSICTDTQT